MSRTDRSVARPALRPAGPPERPDRPGPARRRLPGLDPRQGPALADHLVEPRRPRRRRSGPPSRRSPACTCQEARRRRREEPGRPPRRPVDPREPGRARRARRSRRPSPTSLGHGLDPGRRGRRPHRPATPSARPPPTASGSASSGLMPGAAWARCSSPSTPSCTARWRSSRSSTSTPTTRSAASGSSLEAEITGGLEHPGIVPVYGLGTYGGGRPYYAMRFIRGDSLKEAIDRLPRTIEALKTDPGRRVAGAAQAAPPVHRRLQRHRLRPLAAA